MARFVIPGVTHHITQRGNLRQDVFFGERRVSRSLRDPSRQDTRAQRARTCLAPDDESRANGAGSPARVTPTGKARSCRNATAHSFLTTRREQKSPRFRAWPLESERPESVGFRFVRSFE